MRRMMMRTAVVVLVGSVLLACGIPTRDDHADDARATLSIDPAASELVHDGVGGMQTFSATLTYPDGVTRDVSGETAFAISGVDGRFTYNTVTVFGAGRAVIEARWNDKVTTAELIAKLDVVRVDPGLSPSAPELFGGASDLSRAPVTVYPAAGIVMPRNLGGFETHWIDSSDNDTFEVSLRGEYARFRLYVPGGNGLASAGPHASWAEFGGSEWDAVTAGGNEVEYQVRGVRAANPQWVGTGPVRRVVVTNETMEGAIYYWSSPLPIEAPCAGTCGIFRHDMTQPGSAPEEYLTNNQTNGRCVGCHVLSRDGNHMAVTYHNGTDPISATLLDVPSRSLQAEQSRWGFGTFTPDGSQFLSVEEGKIVVRSTVDQAVLATMVSAGQATQPDLSPDGAKLVYVRPGVFMEDWRFDKASVYVRSYDQATGSFGPEQPLVVASGGNENNYYPSWSPDGQWILFNRGTGSAYNDTQASVWVVKADGSLPPVPLSSGNLSNGLTNSWPRWAPFAQTSGAIAEPMFWITVSSKRDVGVRLINRGRAEDDKVPQLWMFPFYPERASSGDPSVAAFRLPFQEFTLRNHIAQWTERIVTTQ
jgi:hypothetical protein